MTDRRYYKVIYADPPWSYGNQGFGKRQGGVESRSYAPESGRYSVMSIQDIKNLGTSIEKVTSGNAACLLWVTSPFLKHGIEVMEAWGFKYSTIAFCWSKITSSGKDVANLGYYTLGNVELCLLGIKGSVKRQRRDVRQLVRSERRAHSMKPLEVRNRIDLIFGDVPKLELFAREKAEGWDVWGDQVESDVELELPEKKRASDILKGF